MPATGFSIGVSRLMTALKNLGKLDTSDVIAPVVVLVMDRDTESLGRYQKMVAALRQAGIRAEMYLGGAGKKAQMKYADRRGCPFAIIQGGDERAQGVVQIKDLIEGKRLSGEIEDNEEWREGRPGAGHGAGRRLVAKVKKILAAQAEDRARGRVKRVAVAPLWPAGLLPRKGGDRLSRSSRPLSVEVRVRPRPANLPPCGGAVRQDRGGHRSPPAPTGERLPMTSRYPAFAPDLLALFAERGAEPVDTPVIQPAEPFLDMAGEDLRRRIFLTESETGADAVPAPGIHHSRLPRPHRVAAGTPRRYSYLGEVFRQRREGANEFFQAGIEDLGDTDIAERRCPRDRRCACDPETDAAGMRADVTLGDQSVFEAVVAALGLPPAGRSGLPAPSARPRRWRRRLPTSPTRRASPHWPTDVAGAGAAGDETPLAATSTRRWRQPAFRRPPAARRTKSRGG